MSYYNMPGAYPVDEADQDLDLAVAVDMRPARALPRIRVRALPMQLTCDTNVADHRSIHPSPDSYPLSRASTKANSSAPTASDSWDTDSLALAPCPGDWSQVQEQDTPKAVTGGSWDDPLSALSTRSYLVTPASSLCSTPPAWESSMAPEPLQLTFGIELEHLFTFRRSPGAQWKWMFNDDRCDVHWKYEHGTMEIQQKILQRAKLECSIKQECTSKWDLVSDRSIKGPSILRQRDWLETHLSHKQIRKRDRAEWFVPCFGHELVSRVLTVPVEVASFDSFKRSKDVQEIGQFLKAMHGGPTDPYAVFTNETCGLHVHVARTPQPDSDEVALPLPVQQHLAYILVQYEDLITSMHPSDRRDLGGSEETQWLGSNLMGFRRSAHSCPKHVNIDLERARRMIFAKNMTPACLGSIMNTKVHETAEPADVTKELRDGPEGCRFFQTTYPTRYHFVNFDRIVNPPSQSAMTIEFRQGVASLDFDEVARWVHFVLSLVKAAERMARASPYPLPHNDKATDATETDEPITTSASTKTPSFPAREGAKYTPRGTDTTGQFTAFFDLLHFDNNSRTCWIKKWLKNNPDKVLTALDHGSRSVRIVSHENDCKACREIKQYECD